MNANGQLSILAPTRYPWSFNGPRKSRHIINRRSFIPFNKLTNKLEGITILNAPPWERRDLIHAFNRIPLNSGPFIIGFESHLPRGFGLETTAYFNWLRGMLADSRCKRIIAISELARRTFIHFHQGHSAFERLMSKLEVRYPNVALPPLRPLENSAEKNLPIRIFFVGNHFARKGGCVAVRVAEMALQKGLPVEVTIASTLELGAATWTDPLRPEFFDPYLKLLDLPNVVFHRGLANDRVHKLLAESDFLLLTTFSDTFGYSAVEALANGTPVIGTRGGALPEFLDGETNSILLDLETAELGDWRYSASTERDTPKFEKLFADEVERLARETYAALEKIAADKGTLPRLRAGARRTAETIFNPDAASDYWDSLYEEVAAKRPAVSAT